MLGYLSRSVIRLVVTVAILGAIYLLILKPILDTTNNTINQAFEGSDSLVDQISNGLDTAGLDDFEINLDSQQDAEKLLNCIKRANGHTNAIKRCVNRFG